MVRLVHISCPNERKEQVLSILRDRGPFVSSLNQFCGLPNDLITFKSVEKHLPQTLGELEFAGIGIDVGTSIDIIALASTQPRMVSMNKQGGWVRSTKRKYKITDRLSIAEIEDFVDNQVHLTFDYLALAAAGAMLAGVGLCQDSPVTVIASMLVSPLMGPIVGFTYGFGVQNYGLCKLALRNVLLGTLVCLVIGMVTGLIAALLFYDPLGVEGIVNIPESFNGKRALLVNVFIAWPSGVGVALATTNTFINGLVGVAISAALLPPLVNSGLCLAMGVVYRVANKLPVDEDREEVDFLIFGCVSFGIFAINLIFIFLGGTMTFYYKRVWYGISDDGPSISKRLIERERAAPIQ